MSSGGQWGCRRFRVHFGSITPVFCIPPRIVFLLFSANGRSFSILCYFSLRYASEVTRHVLHQVPEKRNMQKKSKKQKHAKTGFWGTGFCFKYAVTSFPYATAKNMTDRWKYSLIKSNAIINVSFARQSKERKAFLYTRSH